MPNPHPDYPAGFQFGVTTGAIPIEGAAAIEGRGPSIWDAFSHGLKNIEDGSTSDFGADHYNRYLEDVALIKQLGVDTYRFSIGWSRVQPEGQGSFNEAGFAFYDRLIDALLEAGIKPEVNLYKWDLPQALQMRHRGWVSRDVALRFADYAAEVGSRFADRVGTFSPMSSANVHAMMGYGIGEHAPGRILGLGLFHAAHHLNLAQGLAISALRAAGAKDVGVSQNHQPVYPASEQQADVEAAGFVDHIWNDFYCDVVLDGAYPATLQPLVDEVYRDGDGELIAQPIDFYGIDYFSPMAMAAPPPGSEFPFEHRDIPGAPLTDTGWSIVPHALADVMRAMRTAHPDMAPFVVTENGAAFNNPPTVDGVVQDDQLIDYLDQHLAVVRGLIAEGIDVRGYHVWSLLDGFEFNRGVADRYGLVHVDHDSFERTPKKSFHWYAKHIAAAKAAHTTS